MSAHAKQNVASSGKKSTTKFRWQLAGPILIGSYDGAAKLAALSQKREQIVLGQVLNFVAENSEQRSSVFWESDSRHDFKLKFCEYQIAECVGVFPKPSL